MIVMDDIQRLNKQIESVRADLQKQIEQLKARNSSNYKSEDNLMILKTTSTISTWKRGDIGKIKNNVLVQFDGTETSSSAMPVVVLNGTGGKGKSLFVLVEGYANVLVGQAPVAIGDKLKPYSDGTFRKVVTDSTGTKAFWVALESTAVSGVYIKAKFLSGGGGGSAIYWAKITAVTDANNYTASIYYSRANSTADETSKSVRVWDITDSLYVNDWIPVIASEVSGKDYECSQQLGLL